MYILVGLSHKKVFTVISYVWQNMEWRKSEWYSMVLNKLVRQRLLLNKKGEENDYVYYEVTY